MFVLHTKAAADFLDSRLRACAFQEAIKLSREEGLPEDVAARLEESREVHQNAVDRRIANVIGLMHEEGTKVAKFNECWYGFLYVESRFRKALKIEACTPQAVEAFEKQHTDKDLSFGQLKKYLGGAVDKTVKHYFDEEVMTLGRDLLARSKRETPAPEPATVRPAVNVVVSQHAIDRWIQRIEGIVDEVGIARYRQENEAQVRERILEEFSKASCEFECEGESYYIVPRTRLSFSVASGVIKSLWVKDFGFAPEINRRIAVGQVRIIRKYRKEMDEEAAAIAPVVQQYSEAIRGIDAEIRAAEAALAGGVGQAQACVNDGEGFDVVAAVVDGETVSRLEMPYTDEVAKGPTGSKVVRVADLLEYVDGEYHWRDGKEEDNDA